MKKTIIFISGTGRSGTHLIGRTLSSHPEISGRIEEPDTFNLISYLGSHQDIISPLRKIKHKFRLFFRLKNIVRNSKTLILEKSHPSLWLIKDLRNWFPSAKFICVYREVEPTVSSMLEHQGVLSWYKSLPLNKPNRFLGIDESNVGKFEKLELEEKCALRWKSHKNEIFRIKEKFHDRVFIVKYDDFIRNSDDVLIQISKFLNVSNKFKTEKFKIKSLDKWKQKLSKVQIERIYSVIKS